MKIRNILILSLFLLSCEKSNEPKPIEEAIPASTLTQLNYPNQGGTSGDIAGLLGYGYDATGFCDTISVKAKIFDIDVNNVALDQLRIGIPTVIVADNFSHLMEGLSMTEYDQSTLALSSHIKSLWKLALKTDSIDSKYAFTYYSYFWISPRYRIYPASDFQTLVSANFKMDADLLSPKDLISKYGTHVLTYVILGKKVEVLYGIKSTESNNLSMSQVENCFFFRMKQFFGSTPGVVYKPGSDEEYNTNDELLIYNTVGGGTKMCGFLKPTDYNPDNIEIDLYSSFLPSEELQLMFINEDGLMPLYELISDPIKKQEVKDYIANYMINANVHLW